MIIKYLHRKKARKFCAASSQTAFGGNTQVSHESIFIFVQIAHFRTSSAKLGWCLVSNYNFWHETCWKFYLNIDCEHMDTKAAIITRIFTVIFRCHVKTWTSIMTENHSQVLGQNTGLHLLGYWPAAIIKHKIGNYVYLSLNIVFS